MHAWLPSETREGNPAIIDVGDISPLSVDLQTNVLARKGTPFRGREGAGRLGPLPSPSFLK
jgi:hypothetical protein